MCPDLWVDYHAAIERWKEQRPPDAILEEGKTWWNSKYLTENREKLKKHLLEIFREQLR